ncbi:MAG: hypothetical protein WCA10_02205 [Terracidiphilus sp.]
MRWFSAVFFFLVFATMARSETPDGSPSKLDGGFVQRRRVPTEMARPRIDGLTWTLLAADGGARALDAYSTRRMLKNNCGSGHQMAGTSTCNYEQNLPGFITNHPAGIYAFDGAVWLTEFTATRLLIRRHHRRVARLIPFIDFISTTSFAVNNPTLSIGDRVAIDPIASKTKRNGNR